jgi:ERCC4-type nuclease
MTSIDSVSTPETPTTLIVDQREKTSGLVDLLLREKGLRVQLQSLAFGDVIVGAVGIERKTARDFCESLKDGRLFSQLIGLRRYYRKRLVILEGDLELDQQLRQNYGLRGAFLRVAAGLQIPVLRTLTLPETVRVLAHLASQEEKRAAAPPAMPRNLRKPGHGSYSQVYVLSGVNQIGKERAKLLLRHFGTLRAVFDASVDELLRVPGVGPKQAGLLFELANEKVCLPEEQAQLDHRQLKLV